MRGSLRKVKAAVGLLRTLRSHPVPQTNAARNLFFCPYPSRAEISVFARSCKRVLGRFDVRICNCAIKQVREKKAKATHSRCGKNRVSILSQLGNGRGFVAFGLIPQDE